MLTQKITLIVSWFIVGIVITVSRASNYKTKHTLENHSRVRVDVECGSWHFWKAFKHLRFQITLEGKLNLINLIWYYQFALSGDTNRSEMKQAKVKPKVLGEVGVQLLLRVGRGWIKQNW